MYLKRTADRSKKIHLQQDQVVNNLLEEEYSHLLDHQAEHPQLPQQHLPHPCLASSGCTRTTGGFCHGKLCQDSSPTPHSVWS